MSSSEENVPRKFLSKKQEPENYQSPDIFCRLRLAVLTNGAFFTRQRS